MVLLTVAPGTAGPQTPDSPRERLSGGVCRTVLGAQQLQRRLERPSAPATFAITKKLLP